MSKHIKKIGCKCWCDKTFFTRNSEAQQTISTWRKKYIKIIAQYTCDGGVDDAPQIRLIWNVKESFASPSLALLFSRLSSGVETWTNYTFSCTVRIYFVPSRPFALVRAGTRRKTSHPLVSCHFPTHFICRRRKRVKIWNKTLNGTYLDMHLRRKRLVTMCISFCAAKCERLLIFVCFSFLSPRICARMRV